MSLRLGCSRHLDGVLGCRVLRKAAGTPATSAHASIGFRRANTRPVAVSQQRTRERTGCRDQANVTPSGARQPDRIESSGPEWSSGCDSRTLRRRRCGQRWRYCSGAVRAQARSRPRQVLSSSLRSRCSIGCLSTTTPLASCRTRQAGRAEDAVSRVVLLAPRAAPVADSGPGPVRAAGRGPDARPQP